MSAFWQFVRGDWYFALPLFLMSLTALTLVIWRVMLNLHAKTDMSEFLPTIQQKLENEGIDAALKYCQSRTDVIPRKLFAAGLETSRQGLSAMRRAMANVIELEILPDLNFLLAPILAIGKIATMVGLSVTVISMINTFNEIQKSAGGNVTSSAGAIGLALFGTLMGLITAIPLVFAYTLFREWIAKFEIQMKSAAQKLLLLVQNLKAPVLPSPGPASKTGANTVAPETAAARR
jgi:biopolymer transport protein ExbB